MISDDVAAFLISKGVGTSANIFAGQMPEKDASGNNIDPVLGIFEYQGMPPDKIVQLEFPSFQIMTRSADKLTSYNLAHNAYIALNRQTDVTLGTVPYKRVSAAGSVQFSTMDAQNRYVYLVNFSTIKIEEGNIATFHRCGAGVLCGDGTLCGG